MLNDRYDARMWNERAVPVLFEVLPTAQILRLLRPMPTLAPATH